ncbi:MAG: hypothetical protein U9N56_07100 [Actinomycetota bacterium]|nr:hypothetical protein [Actinomycetota bacterium]
MTSTASQNLKASEAFADPVAYLGGLGIEAELVTDSTKDALLTMPAAA